MLDLMLVEPVTDVCGGELLAHAVVLEPVAPKSDETQARIEGAWVMMLQRMR